RPERGETPAVRRPPGESVCLSAHASRSASLLLELDLAGDHRELRELNLERLPDMRASLKVCGDHLVGKSPGRIIGGNDPGRRPEVIIRAPARMRTKLHGKFL